MTLLTRNNISHTAWPLCNKGGWKVEFDLAGTITNLWCSKVVSHTGNHYVISDASWNGSIAPKQSASFGFGVSKTPTSSALPTNLTVNGVAAGASGVFSKVSGSTDPAKDPNGQKTSDGQKTDSPDTKPANTKPSDGQSSDGQPSDGQPSDAKPAASALTAEAKVNSKWTVFSAHVVYVIARPDTLTGLVEQADRWT